MTVFEFAKQLVGKDCRSVIYGAGTGSVAALGFGDRLRRIKQLGNPNLSEADRKFASELELTVYCSWRLSHNDRVVCSWRDNEDLPSRTGLGGLVGRGVEAAEVRPGTHDLEIIFDRGFRFQVFCDVTNNLDVDDNYLFATAEEIGAISLNSEPAPIERRAKVLKPVD
ncbi:hypothetical protein [Woeseia oceani]|uniref:Uncharacterized protein n=1 Tax=Woeseia oceani TaxID=1548547 RepID=A0A193LJT2_9GAMM|nr:hypothetical protein [Woeseia oceani]ANO52659.1 hypothetical protein BA177_17010 [Woeseia oceani]